MQHHGIFLRLGIFLFCVASLNACSDAASRASESTVSPPEPPTFTSPDTFSIDENNQQINVVQATHTDALTIRYSILGGDDQSRFSINVDTGKLVFVDAPDFENPTDSNNNNVYTVLVGASTDLIGTEQTVEVEVTNIDEPPVISSSANVTIVENNQIVTTILANDPEQDPMIISISGGIDQAQFSLDNNNTQLTFKSAPDFETPLDTNLDNEYAVQVTVTAGGKMIQQSITVTVTNSNEAPVYIAPTDFMMQENTQSVATLTAIDPEKVGLTYSLGSGLDNALFTVDSTTGQLAFISAPDFEDPKDADSNNTYLLEVSIRNSVTNIRKKITVTVSDVGVTGIPLLQVNADAKQLNFSWNVISEATHYRLLENPDGASGFTQISPDLSIQQHTQKIAVHRIDWFNASYTVDACDVSGCKSAVPVSVSNIMLDAIVYGKASNTGAADLFGFSVALSGDGNTLAVSAHGEASNVTGIPLPPTGQSNNSAPNSGAVYVFQRSSGKWQQQAYIKASNTGAGDWFGFSVSLSNDGNTLAVGAPDEDSNTIGISNPPSAGQSNNSAIDSGAVYVFQRNSGQWLQQAYVKASNTGEGDAFGISVTLSGDGDTLAVGARYEDSNLTGIPFPPPTSQSDNNSAIDSGTVYLFERNTDKWQQQAYVKASNTGANDSFGYSVALSGNGNTLAVGALYEDSTSGAVYVFQRSTSDWLQQAYVKASNTGKADQFGNSVTLSDDGNTLAVGAWFESSDSKEINPPTGQDNDSAGNAGAVYVFQRNTSKWLQQAYVKASNTEAGDQFGTSVALSGDGDTLAVGARGEDSSAMGINSPAGQSDNNASRPGAVYVFQRSIGTWQRKAYVKASNTGSTDSFSSVALNIDGDTLAVGAYIEDGSTKLINNSLTDQTDNNAVDSGAVYLY